MAPTPAKRARARPVDPAVLPEKEREGRGPETAESPRGQVRPVPALAERVVRRAAAASRAAQAVRATPAERLRRAVRRTAAAPASTPAHRRAAVRPQTAAHRRAAVRPQTAAHRRAAA